MSHYRILEDLNKIRNKAEEVWDKIGEEYDYGVWTLGSLDSDILSHEHRKWTFLMEGLWSLPGPGCPKAD